MGAEQQLYRFLRSHLDPAETRAALALVQNLSRAIRAEERQQAQSHARVEHEDVERRREIRERQ